MGWVAMASGFSSYLERVSEKDRSAGHGPPTSRVGTPEGDAAYTPTEIAQSGPRSLAIRWADGCESTLEVRALRLACACAECVDEWSGQGRLDPDAVPGDVHPRKIAPVGRYAIQITWSDGHDSGIYPYRRLRQLADGKPGL